MGFTAKCSLVLDNNTVTADCSTIHGSFPGLNQETSGNPASSFNYIIASATKTSANVSGQVDIYRLELTNAASITTASFSFDSKVLTVAGGVETLSLDWLLKEPGGTASTIATRALLSASDAAWVTVGPTNVTALLTTGGAYYLVLKGTILSVATIGSWTLDIDNVKMRCAGGNLDVLFQHASDNNTGTAAHNFKWFVRARKDLSEDGNPGHHIDHTWNTQTATTTSRRALFYAIKSGTVSDVTVGWDTKPLFYGSPNSLLMSQIVVSPNGTQNTTATRAITSSDTAYVTSASGDISAVFASNGTYKIQVATYANYTMGSTRPRVFGDNLFMSFTEQSSVGASLNIVTQCMNTLGLMQ